MRKNWNTGVVACAKRRDNPVSTPSGTPRHYGQEQADGQALRAQQCVMPDVVTYEQVAKRGLRRSRCESDGNRCALSEEHADLG